MPLPTLPEIPQLPEILPVFPLQGVLLLPSGGLPLQIFELRYRNMLEDALQVETGGASYIGVVQPRDAELEVYESELPPPSATEPPLYDIGTAGRIEKCERLPDGRYVIILHGVCRFRIGREVEKERGYRRVEPLYDEFHEDLLESEIEVDAAPLIRSLEEVGRLLNVEVDLERVGQMPGHALLNTIAMALPFAPAEKQALLEAEDVKSRYKMLMTLIEMGLHARGAPGAVSN